MKQQHPDRTSILRLSNLQRPGKQRGPVKVGRAGGGENDFVREFWLVGQKRQNHDAGGRITLTSPKHRGFLFRFSHLRRIENREHLLF